VRRSLEKPDVLPSTAFLAALDRRVPHVERTGEAAIARDALALKALALRRIEELERHSLSALS